MFVWLSLIRDAGHAQNRLAHRPATTALKTGFQLPELPLYIQLCARGAALAGPRFHGLWKALQHVAHGERVAVTNRHSPRKRFLRTRVGNRENAAYTQVRY
jgi:hypothetical protein